MRGRQGDLGDRGARMALDVGHRLAQAQGEHGFQVGGQCDFLRVVAQGDAIRFQQQARGGEFGRQSGRADAGHRTPHLRQRIAGHTADFVDLVAGGLRIAVDQAPGQVGLQRHQRQRVAEQVVQVAADAFAFGQRGQPAHFLVRELQLGALAHGLRLEVVAGEYGHRDDRGQHRHEHREPQPHRQAVIGPQQRRQHRQPHPQGARQQRHERRRVDDVGVGEGVVRHQPAAERGDAQRAQHPRHRAAAVGQEIHRQERCDRGQRGPQAPLQVAAPVAPGRHQHRHEQEHQVAQQEEGHPAQTQRLRHQGVAQAGQPAQQRRGRQVHRGLLARRSGHCTRRRRASTKNTAVMAASTARCSPSGRPAPTPTACCATCAR